MSLIEIFKKCVFIRFPTNLVECGSTDNLYKLSLKICTRLKKNNT